MRRPERLCKPPRTLRVTDVFIPKLPGDQLSLARIHCLPKRCGLLHVAGDRVALGQKLPRGSLPRCKRKGRLEVLPRRLILSL